MRPPPQKNRPIGFYLTGGLGLPARVNLPIRPEELTRTETSRLQVNQTLGGAWADSFGAGLAKITNCRSGSRRRSAAGRRDLATANSCSDSPDLGAGAK